MAICIAIIDKDNAPLYIRTIFDDQLETQLKLHYTVHSSLDIIDGRLTQHPSGVQRGGDLRELYLGLLLSSEEYRVYGYCTNTKVKFVVVVDLANTTLRDQEIRAIFKKVHNVYCRIVSNPFYVPSQPIHSKALEEVISDVLIKT